MDYHSGSKQPVQMSFVRHHHHPPPLPSPSPPIVFPGIPVPSRLRARLSRLLFLMKCRVHASSSIPTTENSIDFYSLSSGALWQRAHKRVRYGWRGLTGGGNGGGNGQSESSGLLAGSPRRPPACPTGSTLYTSLEQPRRAASTPPSSCSNAGRRQ